MKLRIICHENDAVLLANGVSARPQETWTTFEIDCPGPLQAYLTEPKAKGEGYKTRQIVGVEIVPGRFP